MLQYSTRSVHQTVAEHIKTHLAARGWTTPGSTPFGAPALEFLTSLPEEYDELAKIEPGKMAITVGDELPVADLELGGPLAEQQIPFFVDVFMDNETHALVVAIDVRDILMGRLPGTRTVIGVRDYTQPPGFPEAPGWRIEFTDVVRERPPRRINWQVVKATAVVTFNDERNTS